MDVLGKFLIPILIATFLLEIGIATPRGGLARVRAGQVARGMIVMLVLGPLLAMLVVRVFRPPTEVTVAIVGLSVVGLLPLAARGARAAHGDVPYAVVLTLMLGIVSLITAGPTARALLSYSGAAHGRPGPMLAQLLVLQGGPLVIGLLIRRFSSAADGIEKVVARINVVVLVAVAALFIVPHLGTVLTVGWRGAGATLAFAVLLAVVAYGVGGPSAEERRTLAGVSNMANAALGLALVSAADLGPRYKAAVVGVFILRYVVAVATQKLVARPTGHTDHASHSPHAGEFGETRGAL